MDGDGAVDIVHSDEMGVAQWTRNTGLGGDRAFAPDVNANTRDLVTDCVDLCSITSFQMFAVDMDGDLDMGTTVSGDYAATSFYCPVIGLT